jgi:hypothetical protein
MEWIGTAVGFILGVASTLVTERIKLWLNRPEVVIGFARDEHCLRFSHAHVQDGIKVFETESKYLRLRVSNQRRFPAKNCRALLTDLRCYGDDDKSDLLLADTLPLRWAYLGFAPIDLPGGTHFYADVISTLQDQKHFTVELEKQPLVLQHVTERSAKYSFDISVVGDNFDPVNARVYLDWKRDWNFENVWIDESTLAEVK